MKVVICNTSKSERNTKSRNTTFYLDKIKGLNMGREFDYLKAFCTDGDIRPPYPYQWQAFSTTILGDDEPFEGVGGSPLSAVKRLYEAMKEFEGGKP